MRTLVHTRQLVIAALVAVVAMSVSGCRRDKTTSSFKPLPTNYKPTGSQTLNKLDILWVVDNSGSMATAQANLGGNFASFVNTFTANGYDYKLAVTGSDAYTASSVFKSVGSCNASYTPCSLATTVVTPLTPNYLNTFINNALVGIAGNGDERAFQSFQAAFANGSNAGFLRSDSFLAVIVLSDEDDFSGSRAVGVNDTHDYSAGTLAPVSNYITYLDTLTGTTGIYRRYSVSTIAVDSDACCATYYGGVATPTGCTKKDAQGYSYQGRRYIDLAGQTNGVVGSICDASYATALANISSQITVLSTQFTLDHPAQPATIYVAFNGVTVPNNATNGWTYSSALQAVQFHGTYLPTATTEIFVDYLPAY